MAIEKAAFSILVSLQLELTPPVRLLCLGYPDLLVQETELAQAGACGPNDAPPLARESDAVARWHGWKAPVFETEAVLNRLGFTPTFIDIHPSRGVERIVDLNLPLPTELHEAFDIVLDGGTVEHCFNIGQAFMNVAQAVRVGGYIVHTNPVSCFNHGFWNLSATAYHDFYIQNGFEVLELLGMLGEVGQRQIAPLSPADRIQIPAEVSSLVVVKKARTQRLQWPTQGKYMKNRELKG